MEHLAVSSLFNVKGQVIVVTGGGTGIGAMMTKALANNGAHRVYILGRRLDKLQETAKHGIDGNILPLQCDVTSQESLTAAADKIKADVGFINVIIANHGIVGPSMTGLSSGATIEEFQAWIWKQTADEYNNTFNLNVTSVFFTAIAFLHLLDAGNKHENSPGPTTGIKSQVIVTSSIAALKREAYPGFAYGSSKSAINHLMKMLGLALIPYFIRANVICPGMYPSEMTLLSAD